MRIDVARPSDLSFVMSSWLRSWRWSEVTREMPGDAYYDWQRRRIEALLGRGAVLVARPDDWDEGIAGWLCCEITLKGGVLHYVYVKRRERRSGIATALVHELRDLADAYAYTHRRHPHNEWLERCGFRYRPRLVRGDAG